MKPSGILAAASAILWGLTAIPLPKNETWQVIIGGDTQGYLAPCGCVKPMSGGIQRRTSLTKEINSKTTLILETGAISKGSSRQDIIKAETLAEVLRESKVDAIQFTSADKTLGDANLANFNRLAGNKFISTESQSLAGEPIPQFAEKGPFLVGTADSAKRISSLTAIENLVETATELKKVPILMAGFAETDAESIAQQYPSLALIIYRLPGNPPHEPRKIGNTLITSPGEKGKHVLRLSWNSKTFEFYEVYKLDPHIKNDPRADEIFARYQDRVRGENLLAAVPKTNEEAFAGSTSCQPCHQSEFEIWKNTSHSHALKTLEDVRSDADPECVPCHVVGLDSTKGFQSRAKTPELSDVACESCHGSGLKHITAPTKENIKRSTLKDCLSCHNLDHSPYFSESEFWEKIKH